MEATFYITEMLTEPALTDFLKENFPDDNENFDLIKTKVFELHEFIMSRKFKLLPGDEKKSLMVSARQTAHKLGNFMSEIVGWDSLSSESHDLVKDWKKVLDLIIGMVEASNYSKHTEGRFGLEYLTKLVDKFFDNKKIIENIENLLLETADSSNCITLNEEQSQALFFNKAFPASNSNDYIDIIKLFYELTKELDDVPHLICEAYEGQSLALLLIGSLLSLKPMVYDTWNRVKDDLIKIKESNDHVTSNLMWHIYTYCYDDLPYSLKQCFLYFACYPIGYEIPTTSLTRIWIAEGFVTPDEGGQEETANKYLEELIQRLIQ